MYRKKKNPNEVKVWDPIVRVVHWSFMTAIIIAFVSEDWATLHEWNGYAVLALVGVRVIWGLVGSRHARFRSFVRPPSRALMYLKMIARGNDRPYLGHNPINGLFIVAMLGLMGLTGGTGWLMTLGFGWLEGVHELLANLLVLSVAGHLVVVVGNSIVVGQNLTKSMVTGIKRMPVR